MIALLRVRRHFPRPLIAGQAAGGRKAWATGDRRALHAQAKFAITFWLRPQPTILLGINKMSVAPSTYPTIANTLWPAPTISPAARGATLAIVGTILLWLSAKVQVPLYPVPITMQTLVVLVLGVAYGLVAADHLFSNAVPELRVVDAFGISLIALIALLRLTSMPRLALDLP